MTPEQHADRARRLADEAERLYEVCLFEYHENINEDDHSEQPAINATDLAMFTVTTQLGQLHAALALLPPHQPSPQVSSQVSPQIE
ncbi:MAG TPA: hypothetical protein VN408_05420 [Actinoplanes sp.]|nr:hypothetical protein [Actinoplanes sp.]